MPRRHDFRTVDTMAPPITAPCGTLAAVRRHARRREPLCEACRLARNAYDRDRARIRYWRAKGLPVPAVKAPQGRPIGSPRNDNGPQVETQGPSSLAVVGQVAAGSLAAPIPAAARPMQAAQ